MPGLIDTDVPDLSQSTLDDGTKVTTAGATGYNPNLATVNNDTDTVSGQLDKILGQGSPLLDRAQAGAVATANSRGLLNSSMAAGAGEAAVIDRALPIAQQDASTFSQQRLTNQQADNTASQFNAGVADNASANAAAAANTSALSKQQTGQQKELAQQSADIQTGQILPAQTAAQKDLLSVQNGFNTTLQQLKGEQATTLANIEANYRSLIQTNQSAAATLGVSSQAIAAILANTNTTPEQKQAAVDKMSQLLQSSLAVIGGIGNVDIGSLLDFTA